jgi:hypothetical protein
VYLRARYYDPVTALFLTVDPLVDTTRTPYAYTDDNPLNYTDLTGQSWWGDLATGLGIAGAVLGAGACIILEPCGAVAAVVGGGVVFDGAAIFGAGVYGAAAGLGLAGGLYAASNSHGSPGSSSSGDAAPWPKSGQPNFHDSAQSPGAGWVWRGDPKYPVGSDRGAWYNPETSETLHPDMQHGGDIGPHWDYIPQKGAPQCRLFPDGTSSWK